MEQLKEWSRPREDMECDDLKVKMKLLPGCFISLGVLYLCKHEMYINKAIQKNYACDIILNTVGANYFDNFSLHILILLSNGSFGLKL